MRGTSALMDHESTGSRRPADALLRPLTLTAWAQNTGAMRLAYSHAVVSQLVESHLAKVEAAGSSPVYRSRDDHRKLTAEPRWGEGLFDPVA